MMRGSPLNAPDGGRKQNDMQNNEYTFSLNNQMTEAQREEITKTCTITERSYDTVRNGRVYQYTVRGEFDVKREETFTLEETAKDTTKIGRVTIEKLLREVATIELAPEPVAEVVTPAPQTMTKETAEKIVLLSDEYEEGFRDTDEMKVFSLYQGFETEEETALIEGVEGNYTLDELTAIVFTREN